MAEAGFAAPSESNATTVVAQAQDRPAAAPADELSLTTEVLETLVTDKLPAMADLTNSLLPPNTRKRIVHTEINKIVISKYGEQAGEFLRENSWMYDRLHETHRGAVAAPLAAALSDAIDTVADDLLMRAATPIERSNLEAAFSTERKFTTWVDCLIREVFPHILPGTGAPQSITFELLAGANLPVSAGIKVTLTWRNLDSSSGRRGILRGSYSTISNFPWFGRAALMMPEDADAETKQLVLGRRRLYVKAALVTMKDAFPA